MDLSADNGSIQKKNSIFAEEKITILYAIVRLGYVW